jgi:hypothetical protein
MTDVKISQLQELDQVGDKDTLIVNDASDGGRTKKVRKENLFADTVKNVTDVGNDAVVSQDLIVNNDIEVGGDVRATGELSFGKLRDHVTQVTVNGIVDNADDFLTLDSTIPTSGAIRGYVVDTMAEMGVGALNDKIEGLRYDIYSKDSAFIEDVIATANLPLEERMDIDSDNLATLEGEFDQFKIDVNRDIGNNNSTLSNLNSRMGVAEGGITTLTNTVASLDTDLSSRIDLTNINLGLLTNRVSTNEAAILSLDSALQIEIAARQQGDANLDSDLTAETNARIDALSALSGDLDSEKGDRFAAINDLISRLDSEKDDRLDAIESVLAQLDSEKDDRLDAIEDLLAELDSERLDRINSVEGVSLNLDSEVTDLLARLDSERADRIQADADLLGLIDSERGARILGDAAVQSNLDSEARALSLAISNLSSKVDSETSNRLDAIEDLLDLLDSERSDRIVDNQGIQTGLDSEISARIDALSELTSSLDSERTSRLADEQSLRQDLTDLINQGDSDTLASAKAHDTLLIGDASIDGTSGNTVVERIDSARDYAIQQAANTVGIENSARIAADSDLQAQIDAEELRAKGEEQRIEQKINNVITNTDPAAIDSLTEIVNYLNDVDSDVRQLVSSNTTRVSDETSERLAGDSALGVRIDQEIAARRAGDSDLQNAIDTSVNTEASLRSAADSDINARIDQEVLNRLSVGEDLQDNIDSAREELIDRIEQEELLRAVGDSATLSAARLYTRQRDALMIGDATVDGTAGNTITSRIATAKQEANTYTDNEIIGLRSGEVTSLTARMDSAESRLDDAETAIDSATARLTNINKTLSDLIDSESQRAIGVEGNLQSQIDSGLGRTLNLESDLTSMIDSETQRAIGVEGNLQSQIDSATLRLTNINQTLDGLIDSEMNRALDAESELRGLIDSELSRAIDAERFLRDLIDSSLSLSINADSDIRLDIDANTAAIDSEITRAIRVDGELQDLIDSASLRLTNINKTLSDLIDSEMTRALAVEGSLQSQIDSGLSRTLNLESDLLSRIDSNSTSIADEIARAIEAEGDLQDLIDSESTRVSDINKVLSDLIDSETRRAIDVETRLQSQIDSGLERSVTLESDLLGRIDSNATSIAEEIGRAVLAEEALQDAIDSATTRLTNINRTLSDLIDSEMTRAQGVEARLQSQIDSGLERSVNLESDLLSRIDSNSTSIADEITRAILAEGDLQSGIDSATTRLTNINKTLGDLIDSEMNRALDVEKDLQSQIDSGLSRSINLETDLTNMIDSNATDIRANSALINQEIARAILRDSELSTAITQEAETRYSADSALQINIDAVNRRVDGLLDSAPGDLDTILEIIEAFRNADSDLKTLIEGNSSILSTLNTDVGILQGEMDDAEDILDDLQPRMDSAENRLDSLEGRTSVGESDVADLQSRLGSGPLDTVNQIIIPSINELHGEHDLVEGRLTAAESDIAANALYNLTAFDSVISRIEITEGRLDSNSAVLVDVLSDIVSLQLADSALDARILANDSDIALLDLRVDGNDSDIDAIRSTIQNIKGGKQVLRETNPLTVSDDTITLHLADDTSVSVTVNDNFLTGISLNPTTGVLTGFRRDGQTVSTGFDSRYVHNQSSQALRAVNPITVDNDTITLHLADGNTAQVTVDDSDVNNFVNNLTFNSSDGILTASRSGLPDLNVTLDGRYQPTGNYVTTNSAQALDPTNPITVLNDTITLNLADGNSVQVTVNDNFLTGVGFNTTTGLLTAYRNDAGLVTISLDGRYVEQTSKQALDPTTPLTVDDDTLTLHRGDGSSVSVSVADNQELDWDSATGELSISNGNSVDLDGRYVEQTSIQALPAGSALSVDNDTITLTRADGTVESVTISDANTNTYITDLSMDSSLGEISITRNDGGTFLLNLADVLVKRNSPQALDPDTPLSVSDDTITLHRADGTSVSVTIDDEFYPDDQTLSWNSGTGEITITDGNTIDIDGRYVEQTSSQALPSGPALAVNDDTITLTRADGTTESVTISDANTNTYVTAVALNGSGELTVTRNDGGSFTVDLESHFVSKTSAQALHPTNPLTVSDDTITLNRADGTSVSVTVDDEFYTDQDLSWDGTKGELSISDGNTVDLDGRYVEQTSAQALHPTNALEVNDDTITLHKADGTFESHSIIDAIGTDYFITGLSFNTNNGTLTGSRNDGNTVSTNFDGRYVNQNSVQALRANTPLTISGDTITLHRADGTSISVDIDDEFYPDDQTLSWNASSGELTISDGNTVDIDGRYTQTTSAQVLRATNAIAVNDDTITIYKGDGTSESVTISDANTNTYTTHFELNADGELKLTRNDGGIFTIDLESHFVDKAGPQALHPTDALRSSGDTIYLYKGDGTREAVTIVDNNDYITGASFTSGTLALTGSGSAGASVNLDGRYQPIGNYVTTTSAQALHPTNALEVNDDTITINKADGTSESHDIADALGTDYFITGLSFNTSDGVLTGTRNDGNSVTASFDGRYDNYSNWKLTVGSTTETVSSGETITVSGGDNVTTTLATSTNTLEISAENDFVNGASFSNGTLSLTGTGDAGASVSLDGRYVEQTSPQALRATNPLTVNNDTITLHLADGTTDTVTISDDNTNFYINAATFSGGTLSLTGVGAAGASVSLDGRYVPNDGAQALHPTDALRISGDTITLYKGDGTYESVTFDDEHYHYQNLSFSGGHSGTGVLSISNGNSVDLDGRYVHQTSSQALPTGTALAVNNDTITLTRADGTTESVTISDANTNTYVTSLSFDDADGTLAIGRNDGGSFSVDLDDRYVHSQSPQLLRATNPLTVSGDTITLHMADGSTDAVTIDDDFFPNQDLSWNGANGQLSISNGNTVDLDGRYQPAGDYVTTSHVQALHPTDALQVNNDTITLKRADGTTESVTISDAIGTDYFVTGISFNTGNGVLTANRNDGQTLTTDFDGRYVEQTSPQALRASNALTVSNDTITIHKGDGTSESVTISDYFEYDDQTLSWNSTSGDLTIADGNTVNLDGRYLLQGTYDNYVSWNLSDGSTSEVVTSGETITIAGGSNVSTSMNTTTNTLTVSSTDTNNYLSSVSWDASTDEITFGRHGLSSLSVDLGLAARFDKYSRWKISDGSNDEYIYSNDTLKIVGSGDVSTTYTAATNTLSIGSTNTYVDGASFNSSNDVLTLSRHSMSDVSVDLGLAERFDKYSHWIISDGTNEENVISTQRLKIVGGGGASTSYSAGANTLTVTSANDFITGASFNTGNGVLSLTGTGGAGASVDLDGRYLLQGTYDNYVSWNLKNGSTTEAVSSGETIEFAGSGASSVSYSASSKKVTISSTDTNNYVNSASFSGGTLTLGGVGAAGASVNLDGRYQIAGSYDNYNHWKVKVGSNNTDNIYSGNTLNFLSGGATSLGYNATTNTITVSSTDTNTDTNNYVDGASFNTGNGILTLSRAGLGDVTVDLDGRYATSNTDTTYDLYASTSNNISGAAITLDPSSGTSDQVWLQGGSNVTVSRVSSNQINIASTDTNNYVSSASYSAGSGKLTLHRAGLSSIDVTIGSNSNNYLDGASFNTGNGELTLSRSGMANVVVDLDGRYSTTDTNTTYSQATSSTLGLVKIGYSENGKNYPVELSNGQMYVNVPWTDTNTDTNTNDYVTGLSFSTSTGVLSATRSGGLSTLTVDLDGRYIQSDANNFVTGASFNTGSGVLSLTGSGSAGASVDLDGRYYIRGDHIDLNDDKKVQFGTGDDYEISFSGSHLYIHQNQNTTNDIYISDVGDTNKFFFNVSTGDFHADGDIIAYSNSVSDEKLKENITVVENAVDKVQQLRGVEFTWKKDGEKSAGVIAQDVEKVLPQAVKEKDIMGEGEVVKTVNYDTMSALFIEAIKEQQEQIEALKAEIKALKG